MPTMLIDGQAQAHRFAIMKAFFVSVFVGSLAAAWFPLIVTVGIALSNAFDSYEGDGSLLGGIVFAFLPLLIALAFVLPASLIIGLPATALLARFRKESKGAYVGIGLVAGFLIPFPVLSYNHMKEFVWTTLLGAFSGAMTGRTWWTLARASVAFQDYDDRQI